MSATGTLAGILEGAGFARAEERELKYHNRQDDPTAYVRNGLKRSFADRVEGMSEADFQDLLKAVLDAWAPFMDGSVLAVPNVARFGIGWKAR